MSPAAQKLLWFYVSRAHGYRQQDQCCPPKGENSLRRLLTGQMGRLVNQGCQGQKNIKTMEIGHHYGQRSSHHLFLNFCVITE